MHWPFVHVNLPVSQVVFPFLLQPDSSDLSPQSSSPFFLKYLKDHVLKDVFENRNRKTLTIATILIANAFEILTSKFLWRTSLVLRIAEFSFISTITAIIVVITCPALLRFVVD